MKAKNRIFEIQDSQRELKRDSEFNIEYLGKDYSIRRSVEDKFRKVLKWTNYGGHWESVPHNVSKSIVFNKSKPVASFYESTRVPGTRYVYVETYDKMRLKDGIALAQTIGLLP